MLGQCNLPECAEDLRHKPRRLDPTQIQPCAGGADRVTAGPAYTIHRNGVDTQVGFDEGHEQPRPDRTLMVRRVAVVSIPAIMLHISPVRWSQCAQPEWSHQLTFYFSYNLHRPFPIEHGIVQTNGKDLVRTDRGVRAIAPYYIEQTVLLVFQNSALKLLAAWGAKEAYNFLLSRSWNAAAKPCMVHSALYQSA